MAYPSKEERVLELFFNEATKHWHFHDIVKTAKVSDVVANKWLKKYCFDKLIIRIKPRGKMPYYLANWDNEQYQLTGGQPTHTGEKADLGTIARGAGFNKVLTTDPMAAFKKAVSQILSKPGPWILVAKIDSAGALGRPPKSPVYIKNQFMEALLG